MENKKMAMADFNTLVTACTSYDPFAHYIDDYTSYDNARKRNDKVTKTFQEVMAKYIDKFVCIPDNCTNNRKEVNVKNLTEWLLNVGVEVVKKVWTVDEITTLMQTNDTVLYGALKKLYACQTADEQAMGVTAENNGIGFNGVDSEIMSSFAEFLLKKGYLSPKQKEIARKKLYKYRKQLTNLANA